MMSFLHKREKKKFYGMQYPLFAGCTLNKGVKKDIMDYGSLKT